MGRIRACTHVVARARILANVFCEYTYVGECVVALNRYRSPAEWREKVHETAVRYWKIDESVAIRVRFFQLDHWFNGYTLSSRESYTCARASRISYNFPIARSCNSGVAYSISEIYNWKSIENYIKLKKWRTLENCAIMRLLRTRSRSRDLNVITFYSFYDI